MGETVESGIVRGRPYGGVMILVKDDLRGITETIVCEERYVIVKIGNPLIVNLYLPCKGTTGRLSFCEDIIQDISSWRSRFCDFPCIVAGDFNCDFDCGDPVATCLNSFVEVWSLQRCDKLFPSYVTFTFVNSLNQ